MEWGRGRVPPVPPAAAALLGMCPEGEAGRTRPHSYTAKPGQEPGHVSGEQQGGGSGLREAPSPGAGNAHHGLCSLMFASTKVGSAHGQGQRRRHRTGSWCQPGVCKILNTQIRRSCRASVCLKRKAWTGVIRSLRSTDLAGRRPGTFSCVFPLSLQWLDPHTAAGPTRVAWPPTSGLPQLWALMAAWGRCPSQSGDEPEQAGDSCLRPRPLRPGAEAEEQARQRPLRHFTPCPPRAPPPRPAVSADDVSSEEEVDRPARPQTWPLPSYSWSQRWLGQLICRGCLGSGLSDPRDRLPAVRAPFPGSSPAGHALGDPSGHVLTPVLCALSGQGAPVSAWPAPSPFPRPLPEEAFSFTSAYAQLPCARHTVGSAGQWERPTLGA